MPVFRILHLLYEELRALPICVQRACGHPYGNVSASCTDLYSDCTKMSFVSEFSHWGGVLLFLISELYIYCTRHHRFFLFVYKVCTGTRNAT